MGFPPKVIVEELRERYPRGARVVLVYMDDPHTDLHPGDKGTIVAVDDIGTIHVNWDCGSSLGVAYGVDVISLLKN